MSDPLKEFAVTIIDAWLEGGELDAYEIEELASNLGLIEGKSVTEECGEFCRCAEGEFPTTCYHKSKLLKGPAPAGEPQKEQEDLIEDSFFDCGEPQPQAPTEAEYCAQCHKLIMKQDVNYGINPDAVCMCGRPK